MASDLNSLHKISTHLFLLALAIFSGLEGRAEGARTLDGARGPAGRAEAVDDQFSIDAKSPSIDLDVLANDSDHESSGDLMIVVSGPTNGGGQVVNNVSHLTYNPPSGFSGTDNFTYTIANQSGVTSTANVTVKQLMTWRIMPIGDSITEASGSRNSYRRPLWHLLNDAGIDVNFVGSQDGNEDGQVPNPDFDTDHEGHWGWRADRFLQNNRIDNWAQTHQPDVALIHLGTNDIFQGQSVSGTIDEIGEIIDRLRVVNPDIIILLAQIIPTSDPGRPSLSPFNQAIPGLASSKNSQRSPVVVVNQNEGFNAANDTYDGIHPNLGGETKIANKWNAALVPLITTPSTIDLEVSTQPSSLDSYVGEGIQLEVSVMNDGNTTATGVELVVALPAEAMLVSEPAATNGANCSNNDGSVVCNSDLNPGAGFTVSLAFQLSSIGAFFLPVEVQADQSDSNNSNNNASVEITIENRAPVLTAPIPDADVVSGISYTADISTYFSDPDNDVLTFSADRMPAGVQLNESSGVVSGTPSIAGSTTVAVTATDPGSATITDSFSIRVSEPTMVVPLPPPPPDQSTSTQGTGGGSVNCFTILALLSIFLRRRSPAVSSLKSLSLFSFDRSTGLRFLLCE